MPLNRNNIVFVNSGKGCRPIITGPKATSVLVRCDTDTEFQFIRLFVI